VEVTLGHKYRVVNGDGMIRGDPMYSLQNGLAARG